MTQLWVSDEHDRVTKTAPTLELGRIEAFLSGLHGAAVRDLEALEGGFWSSAFGYRVDGRELVDRHGTHRCRCP